MMASSDSAAIDRLQETAIDGRTENGRYRQDQLQALHNTLREEAGQICAALQADSRSTGPEIEAEYYLTMQAVKHFYDTVDFEKDLKEEYSVAYGKDNVSRRVGAGLVVIKPTSHTRFYSIVVPLAAAMAAGNCLVLELSDTLRQVDALLRTLLTQALDPNSFSIVKSIPDHPAIDDAIVVDQANETSSTHRVNERRSACHSRCIAIVDRTADIESAAKAIATARFTFGGTSPYAPDLVLVNEFVKKEFFEACSRHATLLFAGATRDKKKKMDGNREEELKKVIKSAEDNRSASSFGSSEFKLIDILDKTSPIMTTKIMRTKISGRYLPIATCSSLTDAIYNHEYEAPLLAGYFFAEPEAAKYLAQFLPCHMSVINNIPSHLLVGPAAPTTHEPDFLYRYNRNMFSVPRPQFVEKVQAEFQKVEEALLLSAAASKGTGRTSTSNLRELATKPLPPTGQSDNKGIGFFEQGLILGAGMYLSVILPTLGFTAYFLGRKGLELAARFRT